MSRPDIPVWITANARDFHATLGKVRADAKRTSADTSSGFAAMSQKLRGGAAAVGRLAGPAALVTAALTAMVGTVKKATDAVLEIDAAARTAGVGFEEFQELKYAAQQNLIGVDALTDGLKEMQLRADEFIKTGAGSAAESFARLGLTARDLAEGLKEPDRLFETIIDRMKSFDKAAQIRIADELFGGTAGEQFVRLMDDAVGSIGRLRAEARGFGVILDQEYLERVEEINQRWNAMGFIVGNTVRGAIIEMTNDVIYLLDRFRDIENRASMTLETDSTNISRERLEIENQILALKEQQRRVTGALADAEKMQIQGRINTLQERFNELGEMEARLMEEQKRRQAASETSKIEFTPYAPTAAKDQEKLRKDADAAAKRQLEAIEGVIDALTLEIDTLGLSEVARETMIQLRRANVDAASEEGRYIATLVDQLYREKEAQEAADDAARRHADAMDDLRTITSGWMEAAIEGTLDWRDVLIDVIRELQSATQGEGIFSGLFSGGGLGSGLGSGLGGLLSGLGGLLFGGFRAGGGDVSAGRLYRINEKDYLEPGRSGRILTPDQMGSRPQRVVLELSPDLVGKVLDEADSGAVRIVQAASGGIIQGAVGAVGLKARRSPGYLRG